MIVDEFFVYGEADDEGSQYYLLGEDGPQDCVYMVFGAQESIWGPALKQVQEALARIANACAAFQPVRIVVRPTEMSIAQDLIDPIIASNVSYIQMEMDDMWARDTLPMIVRNNAATNDADKKVAIGLNFNGWGRKQEHSLDATLAQRMASHLNIPFVPAGIVGEGGGIEMDGEGTAIMTESSWINENRNPGVSKESLEAELQRVFGIQKVIWLPGIKGEDITDAHIDFYARFVKPTVVLANIEQDQTNYDYQLTRNHLEILNSATDAKGRPLTVIKLFTPTKLRSSQFSSDKNFAPGYMNFLLLNGGVIIPEFGDKEADAAAKQTIQSILPDRKVVQVNIDAIAFGGGGIHCSTMHQPTID